MGIKKDYRLKSEEVTKRLEEISDSVLDYWQEIHNLVSRLDGNSDKLKKVDLKKSAWKMSTSIDEVIKQIRKI